LNPETFIKTARNNFRKTRLFWWLDYFDILRNILILFPILLTWLALSEASSAYARALELQPDLKYTPFLALWQSGFAGQLHPFAGVLSLRLSEVAGLDVILIFLVILLSAAVHIARDHHIEKQEKAIIDLAEELNTLIWRLDRIFIMFRQHRYADAEERAMHMMVGIDQYVREMRQQVIEVFKANAVEEKRLLQAAHDTQATIGAKQAEYLDAFANEHRKLVAQTNEQVGIALQQQQSAYAEAANSIQVALTTVNMQAQALEQKQNELTANLAAQQRNLLMAAHEHLEQLHQRQQIVLEEFAQSQQTLLAQGEQIKQYTNDLRAMSSTFQNSVDDFGHIVPSLNQGLSGVNQSLVAFAQETGDMSAIHNRMTDSLQSLEAMIAVFETLIGHLAGNMRASAEQLAAASQVNTGKLNDLVEYLEKFDKSGNTLSDAAQALLLEVQQNHLDQQAFQQSVHDIDLSIAGVHHITQVMEPVFQQMEGTMRALDHRFAGQLQAQEEQNQERRTDLQTMVGLLYNVNSDLTSVTSHLKETTDLLRQFDAISNTINTNISLVGEQLSKQSTFHDQFAQLEGLIKQIPQNGGNGHEHLITGHFKK